LIKGAIILAVAAGAVIFVALSLRPKPAAVSVWTMQTREISETVSGVAMGFIEPGRRVFLQPEIATRIKAINVRRGERVQTGHILVVLDDSDFKDQLRALDAAVPLFEARLKQARAHAAQLKADFGRAQKVFDGGSLTSQQYELAKMALDLSEAESEAAQAALSQAQVNREVVSASLRKTIVRAPFDGLVLDFSLEIGQLWGGLAVSSLTGGSPPSASGRSDVLAAPGTQGLMSQLSGASQSAGQLELVDDSQMFACLDIDENDFWKVKIGQPASLVIDALGKRKLSGTVTEIYPFISRALDQNRTARVKIRLADELRTGVSPGMSVNVEILISSRKDVLAAPTAAILIRPGGKVAFQVVQGRLKEIAVETGISNWEWSEITSGLKAGDRIARPPEAIQLKDGLRVVEKNNGP
jgi:HlyD family secretion protein